MRVLILSCKTGGGHDAAGMAVKEEMERHGHEVVFLDYLTLASEKTARVVGQVYIDIVKFAPKVFGLIYRLGSIVSRTVEHSPVYYVNARMKKYLEAYLKEHPADAIVMPHLYPAETVTYMKRSGCSLPLTLVIMTDYTCIPFWEETDCDYYVIPHKDLETPIVKRGLPKEKLLPFGIPVSRRFLEAPDRDEARAFLHIPARQKVHLVVGGSMGAGDLMKLTDDIYSMGGRQERVIVICGDNKKLAGRLNARYRDEALVQILGRTNRMEWYMKACDCMYTKPGGLTSTEAAAARIPMVHTAPIPGCETKNREFFTGRHLSVSGRTVKEQAGKGRELMCSDELRQTMKHAQETYIPGDAARKIRLFLEGNVKKH